MNETPNPESPSGPEPLSPEQPEAPDAGAARSHGSSTASQTASGGLIGDAGPDFDPAGAGEVPEAELYALPEQPLEWHEEQVRSILAAKGSALHAVVGIAESDWAYTEADLDAIVPPLTRILNRYPATRAAAAAGDEAAVLIAFGGYAARSWFERTAELQRRAAEEPVPITGVAAPEGTGRPEPEIDPEEETWQTRT